MNWKWYGRVEESLGESDWQSSWYHPPDVYWTLRVFTEVRVDWNWVLMWEPLQQARCRFPEFWIRIVRVMQPRVGLLASRQQTSLLFLLWDLQGPESTMGIASSTPQWWLGGFSGLGRLASSSTNICGTSGHLLFPEDPIRSQRFLMNQSGAHLGSFK